MFHSWPCSIIYECSCFIPGLVVSSLSIYVSFLALLTAIWNNIFIQLLTHTTNWFGCNVYIRKRDKLQKWIWCSNRLALKHKCVDTFTYYTYICIEAVLYTTSNVWTQSDTLHQLSETPLSRDSFNQTLIILLTVTCVHAFLTYKAIPFTQVLWHPLPITDRILNTISFWW